MRRFFVIASAFTVVGAGVHLTACSSSSNKVNPVQQDSGIKTDSSPGDSSTSPGDSSTSPGDSTTPEDTATSPGDSSPEDTATSPGDTSTPDDTAAPGEDTGPTLGDSSTPPTDANTHEVSSGDANSATVTVMNYLSWCSVTINGGTPFTGPSSQLTVTPGSTVTIVATPLAGFAIGADPWFGVTQNDGGAAPGTDLGSGQTETTTATVIAEGLNGCVSVCCGDAPNGTNCPTTNPCP